MLTLSTVVLSAAIASPPSGRPPVGPLSRHSPKIYDVTFDVQVVNGVAEKRRFVRRPGEHVPDTRDGRPRGLDSRKESEKGGPWDLDNEWWLGAAGQSGFQLVDTPIILPLITMGSYSVLDQSSFDAQLYLSKRADAGFNQRSRLEQNFPFHQQAAVMPIVRYSGWDLRWTFSFRAQTWNSHIDDAAAQRIPWPREWPEEVKDALEPQEYIESDDPIFAETIQRVAGDQLRMVPPYLAAKDLIRYCIRELRVNKDGVHYADNGRLIGMDVIGAKAAAEAGVGSPNDLVCVCVAILRAAGIPARPVIGVYEDESNGRDVFVSWAEFFLPQAGWIPFDPDEMRGRAIQNRNVLEPWPDFGTLDELNERIPMSHCFDAPNAAVTPRFPSVWGWNPNSGGASGTVSIVDLEIISRGRGVDDGN